MSARVITFFSSKGGSGKTSTAQNICGVLAKKFGYKVLLVDTDASGDASFVISTDEEPEISLDEMICQELQFGKKGDFEKAICHSSFENFDFAPIEKNNMLLAVKLMEAHNKQKILKRYINQVRDDYDYIIIDTTGVRPEQNIMVRAVFSAADYVIIPTEADGANLGGVDDTKGYIDAMEEEGEDVAKLLFTFFNKFNPRASLQSTFMEQGESLYGKISPDYIPYSESVRKAVTFKTPVVYREVKENEKIIEKYVALANSIIKEIDAQEEE